MTDFAAAKARLEAQLAELERRRAHLAGDEAPANPDWAENATEHQFDDVLAGEEGLVDREIGAVRRALGRIEDGSYGECARCGGEIAEGRLIARPEASLCIACASAAGG
jgi:RNA polymerase-binding transcription factor DksA